MYSAGSYLNGNTLLHRLDPRVKLLATVALSIIILASLPLLTLFVFLALLLIAFSAGVRPVLVLQALKPLRYFIVLIFLVHVFFSGSAALVRFPYFRISVAGLQLAATVTGQFICLILAAIILTMTTSPSKMIAALKYFLSPLKYLRVPIDDMAVMIMLALRLTPLLMAENKRIEVASQARCCNLRKTGCRTRIKAFITQATAVLRGVLGRADHLAAAMEARRYQRGVRTSAEELSFSGRDFIASVFLVCFFVIFIALNSSLR